MARSRIASPNRILAGGVTATASTEATGRPASYLLSPWRSKRWRSATSTADQTVVFDFGSAKTFQALFALNVKLHASGGTLTIQANATDAWGAPSFTTGVLSASSARSLLTGFWAGGSQSFRFVRYFFDNVGAVSDYVELGLAHVSPFLEPPVNVRDDVRLSREDPSIITASPDGQRQAHSLTKFSRFEGEYSDLLLADAYAIEAAWEAVGQTQPVIFSIDPDDLEQTIGAYFMRAVAKEHVPDSIGRYAVPIAFEEAR